MYKLSEDHFIELLTIQTPDDEESYYNSHWAMYKTDPKEYKERFWLNWRDNSPMEFCTILNDAEESIESLRKLDILKQTIDCL